MNEALSDESHPDYFNRRRTRILDILKKKNEYAKFGKCRNKPTGMSKTGCIMEIYKSIEPNGEKRGKELLDAIQSHYEIKDKDILIHKKGGKRKTRKRR